ncbi:MAG: hypothetical protein QM820_24900 [Minicystis sp.]
MNRPRSSPALTALIAIAFFVLLAVAVLSAPFWFGAAQREWLYYKNRNNPSCRVDVDCIPYALQSCAAPDYFVACRRKDEDFSKKGLCICGTPGLWVRDELEYLDGGVDASR